MIIIDSLQRDHESEKLAKSYVKSTFGWVKSFDTFLAWKTSPGNRQYGLMIQVT